jgi:hypothetical protein
MKVTDEIISSQGFTTSIKDGLGKFSMFTKSNGENFFIVIWFKETMMMQIHKFPMIGEDKLKRELVTKLLEIKISLEIHITQSHENDDDPSVIFYDKVPNVLTFFLIIVQQGVVLDNVSLPQNIVDQYLESDYEYDEQTFDGFTKLLITMFNSVDEYENSSKVWNHYQRIRQEKNWTNEYFQIL